MKSPIRLRPTTGSPELGWLSVRTIAAAVVGALVVLPLLMLILGATRTAAPGQSGTWSLTPLTETYTAAATYTAIGNSLLLALTSALLSTALGLMFAWISTRTHAPGRALLTPVMTLLVAIPPLLYALSWNLLGAREIGLLAKAGLGFFDINSWAGVILVVALKGTGFAYLLLLGPVSRFDTTVLESGRVFGGSGRNTLWHIALPILRPTILSTTVLNIVVAFAMFDIPQIIGFPAGIRFFSTQLYQMLSSTGAPHYNTASALALFLVALLSLLAYGQARVMRGTDFTTVGGRGIRTDRTPPTALTRLAGLAIAGFVILALAAPLTQLILGAFQPVFGVYSGYTSANFAAVLADQQVITALWVTVRAASLAAMAAMTLAFAIAYLAARRRDRLSRLLASAMWLPWAMPGIVLALGITWAVVDLDILHPLYGTNALLLAGLVVIALPIGARTAHAAIAQIAPSLEEASRVSGASAAATAGHILARLVATSFVSGWFLGFIMVAGVLDLPLILASRTDPPLPVVLFTMTQTGHTAEAAAACVLLLGAALALTAGFAGLRRTLRFWAARTHRVRPDLGARAAHDTGPRPAYAATTPRSRR